MVAENRIITYDYSLYNTANVVFKPKFMNEEELYNGYIDIYKQIYSFKNILSHMPKAKRQLYRICFLTYCTESSADYRSFCV